MEHLRAHDVPTANLVEAHRWRVETRTAHRIDRPVSKDSTYRSVTAVEEARIQSHLLRAL